MTAARTLRLEYGLDGVKVLIFRPGTEPNTYDDLVAVLASRIPALAVALENF
ncbi:hypothetical protein HDU93_006208, partial [Gonapodya sp. JEL0774]